MTAGDNEIPNPTLAGASSPFAITDWGYTATYSGTTTTYGHLRYFTGRPPGDNDAGIGFRTTDTLYTENKTFVITTNSAVDFTYNPVMSFSYGIYTIGKVYASIEVCMVNASTSVETTIYTVSGISNGSGVDESFEIPLAYRGTSYKLRFILTLSTRSYTGGTNYGFIQLGDLSSIEMASSSPAATITVPASATLSSGTVSVTFQNSTTGADSYVWDFGDGQSFTTTSTSSFTHDYTIPGDYTIVFTAFNTYGQTTLSQILTIYAENAAPDALFYVSDSTIADGQKVRFTNATIPGKPSATTYSWSPATVSGLTTAFEDGSSSTDRDVTISFDITDGSSVKDCVVTLTASNSTPASDTYNITIKVFSESALLTADTYTKISNNYCIILYTDEDNMCVLTRGGGTYNTADIGGRSYEVEISDIVSTNGQTTFSIYNPSSTVTAFLKPDVYAVAIVEKSIVFSGRVLTADVSTSSPYGTLIANTNYSYDVTLDSDILNLKNVIVDDSDIGNYTDMNVGEILEEIIPTSWQGNISPRGRDVNYYVSKTSVYDILTELCQKYDYDYHSRREYILARGYYDASIGGNGAYYTQLEYADIDADDIIILVDYNLSTGTDYRYKRCGKVTGKSSFYGTDDVLNFSFDITGIGTAGTELCFLILKDPVVDVEKILYKINSSISLTKNRTAIGTSDTDYRANQYTKVSSSGQLTSGKPATISLSALSPVLYDEFMYFTYTLSAEAIVDYADTNYTEEHPQCTIHGTDFNSIPGEVVYAHYEFNPTIQSLSDNYYEQTVKCETIGDTTSVIEFGERRTWFQINNSRQTYLLRKKIYIENLEVLTAINKTGNYYFMLGNEVVYIDLSSDSGTDIYGDYVEVTYDHRAQSSVTIGSYTFESPYGAYAHAAGTILYPLHVTISSTDYVMCDSDPIPTSPIATEGVRVYTEYVGKDTNLKDIEQVATASLMKKVLSLTKGDCSSIIKSLRKFDIDSKNYRHYELLEVGDRISLVHDTDSKDFRVSSLKWTPDKGVCEITFGVPQRNVYATVRDETNKVTRSFV